MVALSVNIQRVRYPYRGNALIHHNLVRNGFLFNQHFLCSQGTIIRCKVAHGYTHRIGCAAGCPQLSAIVYQASLQVGIFFLKCFKKPQHRMEYNFFLIGCCLAVALIYQQEE